MSRESARTVDRQRRRVIRQQVGHSDVRRSQRLAISREWAAERRTLETADSVPNRGTIYMHIILSSQTTSAKVEPKAQ